MNHGRILPLILIMAAGCAALLLRLYQVQVQEHEIWARQALGLTYSGQELPYKRGSIRDTHGNVLARSKSSNHVALLYRDFRREHYLGQLAHARSLLEARSVGLPEARRHRRSWALELLQLTPLQLESFAKGKAVQLGSLSFEASDQARAENRPRRAKDIAFYARYLLHLDPQTRGRLEKLARNEGQRLSFLELAVRAQQSGTNSMAQRAPANAQEQWQQVAVRIERFDQRLQELAELLFQEDERIVGEPAVETLVRELEAVRSWVEDQTASKLFSEAAGFVAGRIEPATLLAYVDLEWIAKLLAWDEARLLRWAVGARAHWKKSWLAGYALPRLNVQLQLSKRPNGALPDEFLSRMAGIFRDSNVVQAAFEGSLPSWRDARPKLLVISELEDLFEARLPADFESARPILPFEDSALRERLKPGFRDWAACLEFWSDPDAAPSAQELKDWIHQDRFGADLKLAAATGTLVQGWDALLQLEIVERLKELRSTIDPRRLSAEGRLVMFEDRRERAAERAEYFLKDYGRRARSLVRGEPDYEVIYRLTRYESDYPGFFAREAPKREYPILPEDRVRIAPHIIGGVSSVPIDRLVGQQRSATAMAELKANPSKSEAEQEELSKLVGLVELPNEARGFEGVEAYWNRELSGLNGFREVHGLDSLRRDRSRQMEVRERENGKDLTLTLDSVLQRAVQGVLRNPYDGRDPLADPAWYAEPVGAAVLLSVQGDLLAAVSEPDDETADPNALRAERRQSRERTFRVPTFQPPGSVFKPFVAAYVLSEHGFDPSTLVECGLNNKGRAGYKWVDCHSTSGHGSIPLYDALIHSCNAYFAFLGESMSDAQLRQVVSSFGFDQRSGIGAQVQARGSLGFAEDLGGITDPKSLAPGGLDDRQRMMVGNGLAEMVATPVALARATLALATGEMRDLRLVRRIGEEEQPLAARHALGIQPRALEIVREAMHGVVLEGSAERALNPDRLGLDVAAKTGSADLTGGGIDENGLRVKVRKHTWVIGWLPYENPELIFAVFIHDTRATSSHGAIYVTQQLLQEPAVLDWLDGRGVDTQQARELGARR